MSAWPHIRPFLLSRVFASIGLRLNPQGSVKSSPSYYRASPAANRFRQISIVGRRTRPQPQNRHLTSRGWGTERVESLLQSLVSSSRHSVFGRCSCRPTSLAKYSIHREMISLLCAAERTRCSAEVAPVSCRPFFSPIRSPSVARSLARSLFTNPAIELPTDDDVMGKLASQRPAFFLNFSPAAKIPGSKWEKDEGK